MFLRTRPLTSLILSALFTLHMGACSTQQEASTEESMQASEEQAPAEASTDGEKSEADSEKEKAMAEASSSDFTDPNQVQLNGEVTPTTAVDSVDSMPAPEAPALADDHATAESPAPIAPDLATDSSMSGPSSAAIYFALSSARVTRKYRQQLKDIAAKLKTDRSIKVTLLGHCDNRGSAAFNRRLALKRARAVKAALIKMGVKGKQVNIGAPQLAQSGETEQEHAQNRRVEVEFQ